MKKNHLFTCSKMIGLALIGATTFFFASCAQDGYDDGERWASSVQNQTLANPTVDDITIAPTVDRKQTKISWNVVHGAAKYECKVYDITDDKNEVLLDSIIDGVEFYIPRVRDTFYRFTIHTIADSSLGNTSPEGLTSVDFDAKLEIFGTIDGSDDPENPASINDYFKKNPVPDNLDLSEFNYNLQANKYYKVTAPLIFKTDKSVMLRCEDETQQSNVVIEKAANFVTAGEFTLEGLNITCSATDEPLIELSSSPNAKLVSDKDYYIINSINLTNCNILGLKGSLIYDNKKQYWIVGLNIENVLLHLNTSTEALSNQAIISLGGVNYCGAKDFNMTNSTVYETGTENYSKLFFLRYGNNARVDRPSSQWTSADHTNINYVNNTFYNVNFTWGNYGQFANYTLYEIRNNIWVNSGNGNLDYIIGGRRYGTNSSAIWDQNTYWYNGEEASAKTTKDISGTHLTTDPDFVDPTNGNFKPQGAEQLEKKTGDPRWLQ